MSETKSICCYCGVGCGVIIESDGRDITGIRGDPDHPANFGRLCTKGATLHLVDRLTTRALQPEMRAAKSAPRQPAAWEDALHFVAERFANIIEKHGKDSVGFYISGQLLTEEYYVFNKLVKGLIGTNNVDTNSRLCMSSAVAGYKATLGADAPPTCYEDLGLAHCLFIAGANMAYAHPVLFRRIEDAKAANPDLKIIVVDPRRTDTAAAADLFLPILPGTDVALFNGMLHVMLWEGWVDNAYIKAHTEGFAAIKATVREYTPAAVAQICGVPAADIVQAAKWFATSPATLSLYCQGLNQSTQGTDKNTALINLHLATAQIGKVGAGPFSLTGQPNAMGGREVGGMANLISAHRDMANPEHRAEVAALWGVDSVPDQPGKTAVEMFEAVRSGTIKALWIACTNPAQSMPDQKLVREALEKAELVVVQDAYANTETVAYADVLLPAATWGEKSGTMTNSERRIAKVRRAVPPPGNARPDWEIVADFARRLEMRLRPGRLSLFPYTRAEEIFNEHRESTRGRDVDITGLSYALLDEQGPQQWPFSENFAQENLSKLTPLMVRQAHHERSQTHPVRPELVEGLVQRFPNIKGNSTLLANARLYTDGIFATANGRARFKDVRHQPLAEATNSHYPFHLNTGRLRDQWHGMSRSGSVARLFGHVELPLISMAEQDMKRHLLQNGDLVKVKSRRGEIILHVTVSAEQRPGQVFIPMHWGSQYFSGSDGGGVNTLTLNNFDPVSKQPELKHAAVRIEKLDYAWQMVAMTRLGSIAKLPAARALLKLLGKNIYASCGLFGREQPLLVLRVAAATPLDAPAADFIAALDALLELDHPLAMNYTDAKRGISKRARIDGEIFCSLRLTGETAARDWLKEMLVNGVMTAELRRWMLAPLAAPPAGSKQRGKIICNCFDVSAAEITAQLTLGASLTEVQQRLKCGSECGSCLPEVKSMVHLFTLHPAIKAA